MAAMERSDKNAKEQEMRALSGGRETVQGVLGANESAGGEEQTRVQGKRSECQGGSEAQGKRQQGDGVRARAKRANGTGKGQADRMEESSF
eukprot:6187568-Pleurochrysis_carterae.AAC.1